MKIPPQHYRYLLWQIQPASTVVKAVRQHGWCDQRIVVVGEADERLDFVEQEFIGRTGKRLYGSGTEGSHG